ncbi:angiotensinogen [Tachyglossus aculeatus]|uniref:angiotensinogen n=1 Tax=Tachyglossus aculeatus TaxID=9261 RepID=UPI0018F7B291|nr:angiotensinogen [Tachyglossus aculeatus]XP_038617404.1 angiotensinogen [Tachyglossus aculeatus]
MARTVTLLCLLGLAAVVAGDRVYVHPFHFLTNDPERCAKPSDPAAEAPTGETFVPVPIQAKTSPMDEVALWERVTAEVRSLGPEGRERATSVAALLNFLGFRLRRALRALRDGHGEAHQGELLAPAAIFGSLASLHLGASGTTASDLQALLGVPQEDGGCTTQLDGEKVLAVLRAVMGLFLAGEAGGVRAGDPHLRLSTLVGLFTSPGLRLCEAFFQSLQPAAAITYARSLDLATDPGLAAERVDRFVGAVSGWPRRLSPTPSCPDDTLLFNTYIRFQAAIGGASRLAQPQAFQVNRTSHELVPTLSVTGTFQYWRDDANNFTVVRVPLGANARLLLVQPDPGTAPEQVEAQLWTSDFPLWLNRLEPRAVHLTLPRLTMESAVNLQDLLALSKLPHLLDRKANFSAISEDDVRLGKVMNKILFELTESGAEAPEEPTQAPVGSEPLEVTLNRPFLLAVYEQVTKALLFLGRATDPLRGV